jgi:hypothetical protein
VLWRTSDISGISGTGLVAEGVQFSDGVCAVRWCIGEHRATSLWENLDDLIAIHGHCGATDFVFIDQ